MKLALFDFDGTITTQDSLEGFIQFGVGKRAYYTGLCRLAPMLLKYKLKLLANDVAKSQLLSYFFKGWSEEKFQTLANAYSTSEIDKIVRPNAIKKINWHKNEGHKVVLVTASMESWLKVWCEQQQVELLATRLEVIEGKITGKFLSKNCYGQEKVNRIKQAYNLTEYDTIFAYGDSSGDKEMLALANKPHYKYF